jgi:class 3 adenylate cyclase
MNVRFELEAIRVDTAAAEILAGLVAVPPPGALDVDDVMPTKTPELVLRSALVASLEWRRFANPLQVMIEWLEGAQGELSSFDAARFWHLRGLAAWRLSDSTFLATRALNTSARLLGDDDSPRAKRYLPRVLDTVGQLLHQQGMLRDARRELEKALALRDASAGDRAGAAITLGNLGRLCIDLGDFEAAAAYLTRDIAIVDELMPERTATRAQLLSHLARCKLRLGMPDEADALLTKSEELARAAGDGPGCVFGMIGKGDVMLAREDAEGALDIATEASTKIAALDIPSGFRSQLVASARKLAASARLRLGQHDAAIDDFRTARRELSQVSGASHIEHAEILRGLAEVLSAKHENAESALSLRLALNHLDATAAETMRQEVERTLKRNSYDSWLLHSAGRFIGQQHIEFLLSEAGQEGFRGARRRVLVMFSDIRGFTTMSERLPPDQLILLLNDFLTHMTRCIERQGGMVDKFIGDAIMAIFPESKDGSSATDAIVAALAMRDELERFNRRLGAPPYSAGSRAEGLPPMSIGIGLHAGEVVAGLIGSPQKREYTVIGDVVNTASRLEGMTKQLGASILVTSAVLTGVDKGRFLLRPLGSYAPKGRKSGLAVFDVAGERDRSPASNAMSVEIARLETALAAFSGRDLESAYRQFSALEKDFEATPRAAGYHLLATHAKTLASSPPPPEWRGEIALHEK